MHRISIVALLSVLFASAADAATVNINDAGSLAAAMAAVQNGDIFTLNGGTTVGVGYVPGINVGITINGNRGTLNFAGANVLTLSSIDTASAISDVTMTGQSLGSHTLINYSQKITINNLTLLEAFGIFNGDGSIMTISNSRFENNVSNAYDKVGGAIQNGGELTINSTVFTGNSSATDGGAINNGGGTVTIGDWVIFSGNAAGTGFAGGSGGAIFTNDILNIGNNVTFTGNSTTIGVGGAISNSIATITIGDGSIFSDNTAGSGGGAIYNDYGTITIGADVEFSGNTANNYGGAIYNNEGTWTLTDGALFDNNKVIITNVEAGGAAIFNSGTVNISASAGKKIIFSNNDSVVNGGAIYSNGSNANITINGDIEFNSNYAEYNGSAIYNINGSELTINGTASFIGNTAGAAGGAILNSGGTITLISNAGDILFSNNSAGAYSNGGAIRTQEGAFSITAGDGYETIFESNSADSAGAIAVLLENMDIYGTVVFDDNHATVTDGGAIYLAGYGTLNLHDTTTFTNNSAQGNGGAIYNADGTVTIGDNAEFTGNSADAGGAIYNGEGTITVGGNATFSGNTATSSGGAIYSYTSSGNPLFPESYPNAPETFLSVITIGKDEDGFVTTFSGNTATGGGGGAIYLSSSAINLLGKNVFENNSALGGSGGAILTYSSELTIGDNSEFLNNSSSGAESRNGGAISANETVLTIGENALFQGNTTLHYGGAIYNNASTYSQDRRAALFILGTGARFIDNHATGREGNGGAIFSTGPNTTMGSVVFSGNSATASGGALYSGSDILIIGDNSEFTDNTAGGGGGAISAGNGLGSIIQIGDNVLFDNNTAGNGGAIYIEPGSSGIITNITVGDNAIFTNNESTTYRGGAISMGGNTASTLTIGNNAFFENNTAGTQGGAFTNIGKSTTTLGSDAIFRSNESATEGGAIYNNGDNALTTIGDDAEFTGNSAVSGGAVNNQTGDVTIGGNATFSNNTATDDGGAILSDGAGITPLFPDFYPDSPDTFLTIVTLGKDADGFTTTFYGNTAAGNGGAIFGDSSAFHLLGKSVFENNSAIGSGGAIYTNMSEIIVGNNSEFLNNSSGNFGGAISSNDSILTIGENVLFQGNESTGAGGAIFNNPTSYSSTGMSGVFTLGTGARFIDNHATGTNASGGAILVNGRVTMGTTVFSGNSATASGGAISSGSEIMIIGADSEFTDNTAGRDGGAISTYNSNTLQIGDNALFDNNTAGANGGAILISSSAGYNDNINTTLGDNLIFTNNESTIGNGGAIFLADDHTASSTILTLGNDALFENNTAGGNGGAIYSGGEFDISTGAKFYSNTAGADGGAIYNIGSNGAMTVNGDVTFSNNSANTNGGAIYNATDATLTLDTTAGNITFTDNIASNRGDDIYNAGDIYIIGDDNKVSNSGEVYSTGFITKTGDNDWETAHARGSGGFIQTAGTTVSHDGFFTGSVGLTGSSSLTTTDSSYAYYVTMDGATFHHTNTTNTKSYINATDDGTLLAFVGDNNIATFDMANGVTGNYVLGSAPETGGVGNSLTINNSDIDFYLNNDYTGTTSYSFTNDGLNIIDTTRNTPRTVAFTNLATYNSTLSFGMYGTFDDDHNMLFSSDQFTAVNYTGDDLKVGTVLLLDSDLDHGLNNNPTMVNAVLGDGMHFEELDGEYYISTNTYEYVLTLNDDRNGFLIDAIAAADNSSLNEVNVMEGKRSFNFSFFDESEIYAIAASLDNMAVGTFDVTGFDDDATHSVIDGSELYSGFKVVDDTIFTLSNLTIANMIGDNGAALTMNSSTEASPNIIVNVSNVIFDNNQAGYNGNGGALISGDGQMNLDNTTFTNNYAGFDGGATMFSVKQFGAHFTGDTLFTDNASGRNGGAVYIDSDANNVYFEGPTTFERNDATSGGGALYVSSANASGGAVFKNATTFTDNIADTGGAIMLGFTGGNSTATFNTDATFDGNTARAGNGGAIATAGSLGGATVSFGRGIVTFTDNSASSGYGGAISLEGEHRNAIAAFDLADGNTVIFSGNTDSTGGNDIFFGGANAQMMITGSGGVMTLNGGISSLLGVTAADGGSISDLENIYHSLIMMYSAGTLEFGTESQNNLYMGDFEQTAGTVNVYADNWIDGTNTISGGTMHLWESATTRGLNLKTGGNFDIRGFMDDAAEKYNVVTLANFSGDSTGNIFMNTNGTIAGTDKLVITDIATGGAILNFTVTGTNPNAYDIEVVDYDGATSGALFALAGGGTIDIGAWVYELKNNAGDGWYLTSDGIIERECGIGENCDGDGVCEPGEDCYTGGGRECTVGGNCDGDGLCEFGEDCYGGGHECAVGQNCDGDGLCEAGEDCYGGGGRECPIGGNCDGDGVCEAGEDCGGGGGRECPIGGNCDGDGLCEAGEECGSGGDRECPIGGNCDGDGVCEVGESCGGGDRECAIGENCDGDGVCEVDEDCGQGYGDRECPIGGNCDGDGVCEAGEDCGGNDRECPIGGNCDGDGICETGEDCGDGVVRECPVGGNCDGDGLCETGEDCGGGGRECTVGGNCDGDGVCEPGEDCYSGGKECAVGQNCDGDGICEAGEDCYGDDRECPIGGNCDGDGICEAGEDCGDNGRECEEGENCDGDGICEAGEDCGDNDRECEEGENCDGDGICEEGEDCEGGYTCDPTKEDCGGGGGKLNTTAQSVMGIPALHLSLVKTGMNELRKRLGELRNNNDNDETVGTWARAYGKHLKVHENVDATLSLGGIEGGIDFMANAMNGKLYFGVMGGYMYSEDIDFNTTAGGAWGRTKTPSAGVYATWIHRPSRKHAYFVDLTARYFLAHAHVEKDDNSNGYDVKRGFMAFSAEAGQLTDISIGDVSRLWVEPKLELRYIRGQGKNFETFAGDQGYVDATTAFSTHLNIQMSLLPSGEKSTWKPYLELGIYNEWLGDTDMEFADVKLKSSRTSGIGFEGTVGTSVQLSDGAYIYGGYTFEAGEIYTSHQLNLGVRTKF